METEGKTYFRIAGLRQKVVERQQIQNSLAEIFTRRLEYRSHGVRDNLIKFSTNINTRHLNLTLLALAIVAVNDLLVNKQQLTQDTFINISESYRLLVSTETTNFAAYYYELFSYMILVIRSNGLEELLPTDSPAAEDVDEDQVHYQVAAEEEEELLE